jgi:hypothetical protein
MRRRLRRTTHVLAVALLIGGPIILFPGFGEAVGPVDGGEWVKTAEAAARTAAGDCDAGSICLEWCFNGVPSGDFTCFDHMPIN